MPSPATAPPFDPELEAVLAVLGDQIPTVTAETMKELREAPLPGVVTDDDLTAAGAIRREITVPGFEGVACATPRLRSCCV